MLAHSHVGEGVHHAGAPDAVRSQVLTVWVETLRQDDRDVVRLVSADDLLNPVALPLCLGAHHAAHGRGDDRTLRSAQSEVDATVKRFGAGHLERQIVIRHLLFSPSECGQWTD